MAAAKETVRFAFLYWTESRPTMIKSLGFTNDYKFCISVNKYQ